MNKMNLEPKPDDRSIPAHEQVRQSLNLYFDVLTKRIGSFRQWWEQSQASKHYENHPDYLAALEFSKTFSASCKTDYGWVVEYGKFSVESLNSSFKYLDEKADAIIKYLGGGTAVIALGALSSVTHDSAYLIFWLLPSFLCAVGSIFFALQVRMPRRVAAMPPINVAIEYAEAYNEKGSATFLGIWHATSEGLACVNTRKSTFLTRATWLYFGAILLLILPIIAYPVQRYNSSPPLIDTNPPGRALPK